jgi:hypothetical protein
MQHQSVRSNRQEAAGPQIGSWLIAAQTEGPSLQQNDWVWLGERRTGQAVPMWKRFQDCPKEPVEFVSLKKSEEIK